MNLLHSLHWNGWTPFQTQFSVPLQLLMDPYADVDDAESSVSSIEEEEAEVEQGGGGLTEEQIESNIRTLSQIVTNNPADYQSRIQLIGLLRQQEEFDDLAHHREALAKHSPLGASTTSLLLPYAPLLAHLEQF